MESDKQTILVVDDDRLIVAILSDMLTAEFEVLTAYDGAEAVALLGKKPVAAILCDQNMPKMTGVEVLQRACELQPKAVRIMVTATESVADIAAAVNLARVNRVVVKPVREVEIPGIVKGAIREAELEEENRKLLQELRQTVDELRKREQELGRELNLRTEELREVMLQMRK